MGSQLSEMYERNLFDTIGNRGYLPTDWFEEQLRQVFASEDDSSALGSLTVLTAELVGKVRKLERDAEEQNQ